MAAHRYWRVNYTADGQGLGAAEAAEVEFRGTAGGPDDTGSGVAVQSSGTGSDAFDNNTATVWSMAFGQSLPQYVGYDFGAGNDIEIAEVAITAGTDLFATPFNFTIDSSDDGAAWTPEASFSGETGWSANETRLYLTGLTGGGPTPVVRNKIVAPWLISAITNKSVSLPWKIWLRKSISASWLNASQRKKITNTWEILTPRRKKVTSSFALTTNTRVVNSSTWKNIAIDPTRTLIGSPWRLAINPSALLLPLDHSVTIVSTNDVVEFKSASLQSDESSWGWRISLTFSDASSWQKLRPLSGPVEMLLTVRGTVFNLISEGAGRSRSGNSTNYTIKGRSITAKMAKGNADQVTKTWLSTTAKTIAQELCDSSAITLDWQSVDWLISRLEISSRYPIDIIKKLAKSVGSVVQTTPSGVLTVRPKYLVAPSQYNNVIPSHVMSDVDDFSTLSESWEARPNYDNIEVGNEAISRFPLINLSTSTFADGVLIKATVVPFQSVVLTDTALGSINIQYLGVVTETITQTVEIVEGKGRLSKPFYGLLNYVYRHVNLGVISITEAGNITTVVGLHSLVEITYKTKWHKWKATSTEDKVQLIIEDLP